MNLLNRILTAAALVALAVTLGVWLTHAPLTAAPDTKPAKIAPEPIPAPPTKPATTPTVIEVPVEVEIADATEPPAAKPAEPKAPEPQPNCQPRRWGLIRRR
jgi:type IV secretory pathway VirB10-like protein